MIRLTIIDYGYGNLHSIVKACQKVMPANGEVTLSHHVADIKAATHVLLPGVGAFADCMQGLNQYAETKEALDHAVRKEQKPFLGVCVGMQLMAKEGHEHGKTEGLGWLDAKVIPLPHTPGLKIPHMGWNNIHVVQSHPIFAGLEDQQDDVYFVHSYYMECADQRHVYATSSHGIAFPAIVVKENMIGMQFHPEKSQHVGLKLLSNFMALR